MSVSNVASREAEQLRLGACEARGLDVTPRYVKDREGREIYVMDGGGDGRPVLFVHGGGGEAGQWIPLAAIVQDAGYRVVLADRPGHGLSYPIEYGDCDYREAAADWVEDVSDALSESPIDIIANSMGGFFSLCFALRRPDRVRELLLLGAPAGLDKWIPWPLRLLGTPPINRLMFKLDGPPTVDGLRKLHDQILVVHADRIDTDLLEASVELSRLPHFLPAWRTLLEECVSLSGFRHMIREDVSDLGVSTHFIHGTEDAFAPPSSSTEIVSRMPNARVDVLEDAGHLPWLDQLDRVAELTLATLAGGDAGQRAA